MKGYSTEVIAILVQMHVRVCLNFYVFPPFLMRKSKLPLYCNVASRNHCPIYCIYVYVHAVICVSVILNTLKYKSLVQSSNLVHSLFISPSVLPHK